MKAAFYTLGCKVNQYDTQMMSEKLSDFGIDICSFNDLADIYIINTCTVTHISDKKSRNIISRAKRKNPNAIVIVCGCFSQVSPDEVAKIKDVDIILGTKNRKNIVEYITRFLNNKQQIIDVTNKGSLKGENISNFCEKTRAIIKIEDGCTNFCSYCLIPFARGNIVSKPLDDIVAEATALSNNGYKEIVLTGIHMSSYGKDLDGIDLADAIIAVNSIDNIKRIRLGSLEPRVITEQFLQRVKHCKKLCPSFHLSLQSGCNKTLKNMNRKYTTAEYKAAVELLRKTFDKCAVTTDIIVGFPGENDADFNECLEFVKDIKFSKIHIFPYSIRKGTKAAAMPEQVESTVKAEREKQLSAQEIKSRLAFNRAMIGSTVEILVEKCENGICNGFTPNYVNTQFECDKNFTNQVIRVKIVDADENVLKAII